MKKRIVKILLRLALALLIILLLLYVLFQTSPIQTWLTQKIGNYLAEELNTEITIQHVDIDLFSTLVLDGINIKDETGNDLANIASLRVNGFEYNNGSKDITFGEVSLEKPEFYLYIYENDTTTNLQFVIDYFKKPKKVDDSSTPPKIEFESVEIQNGIFAYHDYNFSKQTSGIDFKDLFINNIDVSVQDFLIIGDSVHAEIENIKLRDKSGVELNKLSGKYEMSGTEMTLNQAHIFTPASEIIGDLALKYNSFNSFKDFLNKVKIESEFEDSELSIAEIGWFAPALQKIENKVRFAGKIRGKVSNLKSKNLELWIDDETYFKGNVSMSGLPNIEETFIDLSVKELKTNKVALEKIPIPPFNKRQTLKIPDNLSLLGNMSFKGKFTGFLNDFTAYGLLKTAIGNIKSDISISKVNDDFDYNGSLSTINFDIGKFYKIKELGKISSKLSVQGSGLSMEKADAKVYGLISSVKFKDYNYENIQVDGNLRKSFFDGLVSIKDDNLFMDFAGKVDFTTSPPSFSFDSDIQNIDLVDLNLVNENQEYLSLAGKISANVQGVDLETIIGNIVLEDISYCNSTDECSVRQLTIDAGSNDDERFINVNSSIASGSIQGKFDLKTIDKSILRIISEMIPSYNIETERSLEPQNFNLNLDIHDFQLITDFFLPQLKVADETNIRMGIDEESYNFELTLVSDTISFNEYELSGLTVDTRRQDSAIYFTVLNDNFSIADSLNFIDFSIDGRSENDTLYTSIAWDSSVDGHSGEINNQTTIRGNENFDFLFNLSQITLGDEVWYFDENAIVSMDSSYVNVQNFTIFHGLEYIFINGIINEDPVDELELQINAFDLANFNPFLRAAGIKLEGLLSGTAKLNDVYNERLFVSDFALVNCGVNDYNLGDLCLESSWDSRHKRMMLAGELEQEELLPLTFAGFYSPKDEESPLDITCQISKFDLHFLNGFINKGITDLDGNISGEVNITGKIDSPLLNGELNFDNVSTHIEYLNTSYFINQKASIYPDMFTLDYIEIRDQEGNIGHLTGAIMHENFKEWNFDVSIDIEEQKFLCLNTDEEDNGLYYGTAYGQGYVDIYGYAKNLEFDIALKTGEGTKLSLPMEGGEDVSFENFVHFVNVNEDLEDKELDLSNITLNFEMEIIPGAEFEIIFDKAAGDIIRGSAIGLLNMDISTLGTFNMYGNLEVTKGNYLFTLKNLINKEFDVKPGGNISWFGDPMLAEIDLQAVYRLNTSLNDLFADDIEQSGRGREKVDLVMGLRGSLMNPNIGFDIELPNVDEITRSRVEAILDNDDEKNRQAFALLILRTFIPPQNIDRAISSNIVAENTSELISSQLSNWLSKISDDFDLGINYRPGDEISSQEIEVALSTQLFNDRLSVSGNFGVSQGNSVNNNQSALIGDIEVDYKLTDDGKIRLVVYNRSNEYDISTDDASTSKQGVGILYREDFDTLEEFYCGFKNLFRGKGNEVECD